MFITVSTTLIIIDQIIHFTFNTFNFKTEENIKVLGPKNAAAGPRSAVLTSLRFRLKVIQIKLLILNTQKFDLLPTAGESLICVHDFIFS